MGLYAVFQALFYQLQCLVFRLLGGTNYSHVEKQGNSNFTQYVDDFTNKFKRDRSLKGDDSKRKTEYAKTSEQFYNLITDFYEYGWGQSFHFAPRWKCESFEESMTRYEHYVASLLNINERISAQSSRTILSPLNSESKGKSPIQIRDNTPGDVNAKSCPEVLDIGCGIGGPMRSIAKFFRYRAHITGLNITREHIDRARRLNKRYGIKNCDFICGDFNAIPADDNSFDAIYDFEATLHSTDRPKTFKEIYRVLKPGGRYVTAQYNCLEAWNPNNQEHLEILKRVDNCNGCYCSGNTITTTNNALTGAGFDIISSEDMFSSKNSDIAFHEVFESAKGSRFSGTTVGLMITTAGCWIGETLGVLPKGTVKVQNFLVGACESFKQAGRRELLTPGYLYVCQKPMK